MNADRDIDLSRKMKKYIRRVMLAYEGFDDDIASILDDSYFWVRGNTHIEDYAGGETRFYHDIVFFLTDEKLKLFNRFDNQTNGLDSQKLIKDRVTRDINKASSDMVDEEIRDVNFLVSDENDSEFQAALSTNKDPRQDSEDASFWEPGYIRLFISHKDKDRKMAHELEEKLMSYGISAFVAHDNIEPDEEWKEEIKKALYQMDMMVALITDDFFESIWTNQEIGFAVCRGVPLSSLKFKELPPKGFIDAKQAISANVNELEKCADDIFERVEKYFGGSERFRIALIRLFSNSGTFSEARKNFYALQKLGKLSNVEIEDIVKIYNENFQIHKCKTVQGKIEDFVNKFSENRYEIKHGKLHLVVPDKGNDDIPF